MCSLFGVIDFNHSLTKKQLDLTVNTLARVCESRGSDATGIAYNSGRNRRCGADRADFDWKNYFGCPWQCVVPQHTELCAGNYILRRPYNL